MTEDRTEMKRTVPIDTLQPADYNPRTISPNEMERLKRSIVLHTEDLADWKSEDGYRLATTITVNRNGNRIVGGHQRVRAIADLGQEWIHPDDITWIDLPPNGGREKALNVALNSPDAGGQYDYPRLQEVLLDIQTEGLDLELTALADFTLEPLMAGDFEPPEVDPDYDFGGGPPPDRARPIELTQEQRETVERAVAAMVEESGEDLSEGKAVELICSEYLRTRE